MKNITRPHIFIAIALAATLHGATQLSAAEFVSRAHKALFTAQTFTCTFPWRAKADWNNETPQLKSDEPQYFTFRFEGVSMRSRSALMVGNNGSGEVSVLRNSNAVTFLEETASGVTVTTVYVWAGPDKFKAVHSRHNASGYHSDKLSGGGPWIEQYYGYCVPSAR